MKRRRKPLEVLKDVRKQRVQEKARDLSAQIEQRRLAEGGLERVRRAREARQAALDDEQRSERDRLERGAARAGDLRAAHEFAQAVRAELEGLVACEREQSNRVAEERRKEGARAAELTSADAAVKVVDRQIARGHALERVRDERKQADVAADVHLVARHTSKTGRFER